MRPVPVAPAALLVALAAHAGSSFPAPAVEGPVPYDLAGDVACPMCGGGAGAVKATASTSLRGNYGPDLSLDGDRTTAWCEGTEGLGEGETLTLDLGKEVTIKSLGIQGGFYKDDRALINNGRLRKATVESDQGWSATAEFFFVPERKYKAKKVHVMATPVPNAAGKTARVLTLRIDEADEGQFTKDVCVSEVVIEVE